MLNKKERLILVMALEMAQFFMDRKSLNDFWYYAPDRYKDIADHLGLHNRMSNLVAELDPKE
jgi:hypothetical protein